MGSSQEMRETKKCRATILSIGTANPPNEMTQDEFLNFYFRVTNWGKDMTDLKEKFKRICKNTSIRKRHMLLTEEFLKANPQICDENATSFNTREDILIKEVPKLGLEASLKAIREWGQPKSKITHIIFCTVSGIAMPGCDYELLKLLDLSPSVQRFMLYQQGCYGGGTVLRLAKDIVENNRGARVLAVCSEFNTICFRGPGKNTSIRKRHMLLTEEFLKANPQICDENATSFNTREDILIKEVPKLGLEASLKAIKEWGQPKSKITHIIFCTVSGIAMPGCDYELLKLLDLSPSVQRFMLYQQGCYGGGTVLRLAKDIVENNRGARVLAVCSEFNTICFRGPGMADIGSMVGQGLFTDGASAMIIGADVDESIGERPIFEMVSASQSLIPDTKWGVGGQLRETGLNFYLSKKLSQVVAHNIEKPLLEALDPGVHDWNSIFYAVHPGGPAILDKMEAQLGLIKHKLEASRHVLSEFGNMWSTTVIFVLDEIRKRSFKEGMSTTGQGLDYGVLLGIGPGITIETVVLRSFPINNN